MDNSLVYGPVLCGYSEIWWPEVECTERTCDRPIGHSGKHNDPILGSWEECGW